jgi:phosphoribosylamine--glycine ligase
LIWAPGQDAALAALEIQRSAGTFSNPNLRIVRWDEGYSVENTPALLARAREAGVSLVVFSQDADLASGAADQFRGAGFSVFGPSRDAARVEWSKQFTKELCEASGVVTARSHFAQSEKSAEKVLRDLPWTDDEKYVVKADGLAAGKGVVLAETKTEALACLSGLAQFGSSFLIEERLSGVESSWFAFSDGETFSLLDSAKDYKRLHDGQTGPNTGGMGAVSPAPDATPEFRERVRNEVFAPIFSELRRRGIPYQGLLYAGLMADPTTEKLALIEFNARFGDPETQALLPRMQTDLLEWLSACAEGELIDYPRDVPFGTEAAVYVVAAAPGYPIRPALGGTVRLKPSALRADFLRFAGLRSKGKDWEISGGRVLGALGFGESIEVARTSAYQHLEEAFEGGFFEGAQLRKDIGK